MQGFKFRGSRYAEERGYEDLEHERRRREWAERLAESGFNAGEHNMTRADRLERMLGDLLALTDAHREAAQEADAVRTADLRLYRHAGRIRGELDDIEAPPELPDTRADAGLTSDAAGSDGGDRERHPAWHVLGSEAVRDATAAREGTPAVAENGRNGRPKGEAEFPALL